jgi:hypothetical protein
MAQAKGRGSSGRLFFALREKITVIPAKAGITSSLRRSRLYLRGYAAMEQRFPLSRE